MVTMKGTIIKANRHKAFRAYPIFPIIDFELRAPNPVPIISKVKLRIYRIGMKAFVEKRLILSITITEIPPIIERMLKVS